jgi:hypothetical protein
VVVDADEDHLPADASSLPAPIAVDPVAHAVDAGKALGIDVEELSGPPVLVALRRLQLLLEPPDAPQAELLEMSRHGGEGHLELLADLPGRLAPPPQLLHAPEGLAGRLDRDSARTRRAVSKARLPVFLEPVQPLVGRLPLG